MDPNGPGSPVPRAAIAVSALLCQVVSHTNENLIRGAACWRRPELHCGAVREHSALNSLVTSSLSQLCFSNTCGNCGEQRY